MPTTYTWAAPIPDPVDTEDWTNPSNWDQDDGTYPGKPGYEDAIVIIPSELAQVKLNADITIGQLTLSGGAAAEPSRFDMKSYYPLTVTGNFYFHSGTFQSNGFDLTVGGKMTFENLAKLEPGASDLSIGSGTSISATSKPAYALEMGYYSGGIITSGSGEWHIGSMRCNQNANILYFTSENCYINGEQTYTNRKMEITAGEVHHNKGLVYLYSPDDIEGGTPLSDNTIDIQWTATGGDSGLYDLLIDIPYDNRDTPVGVQQTIGIRNDLIVEHYLYLYKGKFRNYSADVSVANQLTVSGCTLLLGENDAAGRFFGRDTPTFQGINPTIYSKYSVPKLELHDTGTPIELGINARGQVGDPGANRDGTQQRHAYAITANGNGEVLMNDADVTVGDFYMNYRDVSGGAGNSYIKLSSGKTTLTTKNWNSYAIWNTNITDNLGNYNNTLTTNGDNLCGVYHNSGTLILDSAETNNYCVNSQNSYANVTYAAAPEYDDLRTGYGRRMHLYNFILSGGSTYKHYFSSYGGAPIIVHNDFTIQAGQTLSQMFASDIQPQSGMIQVLGKLTIEGTLDLEETTDSDFQAMLPIASTHSPYLEGAWPRYIFNQVEIASTGVFKAPGGGNTVALSGASSGTTRKDAIITVPGFSGATFNPTSDYTWYRHGDGYFYHNSGTLLLYGPGGADGHVQSNHNRAYGLNSTGDGSGNPYNLIMTGTTVGYAYYINGDGVSVHTDNDFTVNSSMFYPNHPSTVGGNLLITDTGDHNCTYDDNGKVTTVSGNITMNNPNDSLVRLRNPTFNLYGNFINNGGTWY